MLMPSLVSTGELKVLSLALTQFVDNQCEAEVEEHGESQDVVRARSLLDAVDGELSVRLGVFA